MICDSIFRDGEQAMLSWLKRLLGQTNAPELLPAASYWSPETVEAAIEEAGRAEVFAEARRLGWTDGYAPLWVWGNIAREVSARNSTEPTVH